MNIIVGITGATGAVFGVRMLEWLKKTDAETHLVISPWAAATILHETGYTMKDVEKARIFYVFPQRPGGPHFKRFLSNGRNDCRTVQYEDVGGHPHRYGG